MARDLHAVVQDAMAEVKGLGEMAQVAIVADRVEAVIRERFGDLGMGLLFPRDED